VRQRGSLFFSPSASAIIRSGAKFLPGQPTSASESRRVTVRATPGSSQLHQRTAAESPITTVRARGAGQDRGPSGVAIVLRHSGVGRPSITSAWSVNLMHASISFVEQRWGEIACASPSVRSSGGESSQDTSNTGSSSTTALLACTQAISAGSAGSFQLGNISSSQYIGSDQLCYPTLSNKGTIFQRAHRGAWQAAVPR
jgi:hypothetical protein